MYMEDRRCCYCFPLRFGSCISCLIWAALSMYLAVLSFQNKSLFFSYFPQAPTVVFGVVNLILSLVSVAGLFILLINRRYNIKTLSHAVFVCVFLVLVDGFINLILFITNKSDFNSWCINSSATSIISQFSSQQQNATDFNLSSDFYNCSHLWEDELKFGIVFYILIFAFYIYWAFSLYSYRHMYGFNGPEGPDSPNPMMDPGIYNHSINVPPPALVSGPGGFGQGMPPPPGDRSTIILTNQKPRSKSMIKKKKRALDTLSRNIKKPFSNKTGPEEEDPPYYEDYATLGFEVSKDGELYEIENLDDCHSPAPTYRETERSAKKKSSKQKLRRYDDNNDENC